MQKPHKKIMTVPDMATFVREVSEHGNMGAVIRRVLRLAPQSMLALAWMNRSNVVKLAKKDFSAGMILLIQIELLKASKYQEYVAIADQVVDLSVALGNKRLLAGIIETIKQFGYKPVLTTNNLSHLMKFLPNTKTREIWLAYPRDPDGYSKLLEPSRIIPHELVA